MLYTHIAEDIRRYNTVLSKTLTPTNMRVAWEEFQQDKDLVRPNFVYGHLDIEKINDKIFRLDCLSPCIQSVTVHRQLIEQLWQRAMLNNRLAQAAHNAQPYPGTLKHDDAWNFFALQNQLHEAPHADTFQALYNWQVAKLRQNDQFFNTEERELYDWLQGRYHYPVAGSVPELVDSKTASQFKAIIQDYLAPFWSYIPEDRRKFSAEDAVWILNKIIMYELSGKTTFRAKLAPAQTVMNVDLTKRRILIPADRTFTYKELKHLVIGHEFGTHVMRSVPFERCEIVELARGLPGYLDIEEGIAAAIMQVLEGDLSPRGVTHYVDIGLALYERATFREVYEVRAAMNYLQAVDHEMTELERKEVRNENYKKAFRETMRCFRGTGFLPSHIDMVYYAGNAKAWDYIKQYIGQPDELLHGLFRSGKTDLTNPMHLKVLDETLKSFTPQYYP